MCVCASTVINSSTVLIILFLSSIVLGLIDEMHGPIVCFLAIICPPEQNI